mgnify:CR=1 FL=1
MDDLVCSEVLNFYNFKEELYFIDIGANNGKFKSNTYNLEKNYNWKGICVESLPYNFNTLKNRRKSICENKVLFYNSNKDIYYSKHNYNLNTITNEYIKYNENNLYKDTIKLKTIRLNDLLKQYNFTKKINYLTINCKSMELCILGSVNLRNYKFLYLSIEHNYTEPKRNNIRTFLEKYGYLYINNINWYNNYIHEDVVNGIYYIDGSYDIQIEIKRLDKYHFYLSSSHWEFENDICTINSLTIHWEKLNITGKIYYDYIDYGNGLIWYKYLK